MRRIYLLAAALAAALPAAAGAATKCALNIDDAGNVTGTCGVPNVTPAPTPTPSPTPTPTPTPSPGTCPAKPSNVVLQATFPGGTNNYVFDDLSGWRNPSNHPNTSTPQGAIQAFALPLTWPGGAPVTNGTAAFGSLSPQQSGVQFEVAFSKCPGDFTYYKSPAGTVNQYGQTWYPCGGVYGSDFPISWSPLASYSTCGIPTGEQWYMNWRAIGCRAGMGYTCGQTFYVPQQ